MLTGLRNEIEARFAVAESFFRATRNFKGDTAAAAKGLMFIQMYAIYEYTVSRVVSGAIDAINSHKHKMRDVAPSLLALCLHPELDALKDCGRDNIWRSRLRIFNRAFSNEVVALSNNTRPPSDGSHYRHSHLIMIFSVFGISRPPVRRKAHLFRIDEVVDHRNKIAHGNETAQEIGRRYSREEIIHRTRQMRSVCLLLISIFQDFCVDRSRHKRRK